MPSNVPAVRTPYLTPVRPIEVLDIDGATPDSVLEAARAVLHEMTLKAGPTGLASSQRLLAEEGLMLFDRLASSLKLGKAEPRAREARHDLVRVTPEVMAHADLLSALSGDISGMRYVAGHWRTLADQISDNLDALGAYRGRVPQIDAAAAVRPLWERKIAARRRSDHWADKPWLLYDMGAIEPRSYPSVEDMLGSEDKLVALLSQEICSTYRGAERSGDLTAQHELIRTRRDAVIRLRFWVAVVGEPDWRKRLQLQYRHWWLRGMTFSSEHGWEDLLTRLMADIEMALEHVSEGERECFAITDVKEKYGALQVYHNGGSEIDALTEAAEDESLKICECCGRPGVLRKGAWLSVRCDEHSQGREPDGEA